MLFGKQAAIAVAVNPAFRFAPEIREGGVGAVEPSEAEVVKPEPRFRITGSELWRTDGTTENTTLFADIAPEAASSPAGLTRIGDKIVFSANDGVAGVELWVIADEGFPPDPPSNPGATTITSNSVTWTWQDNSKNETGFRVYHSPQHRNCRVTDSIWKQRKELGTGKKS